MRNYSCFAILSLTGDGAPALIKFRVSSASYKKIPAPKAPSMVLNVVDFGAREGQNYWMHCPAVTSHISLRRL